MICYPRTPTLILHFVKPHGTRLGAPLLRLARDGASVTERARHTLSIQQHAAIKNSKNSKSTESIERNR